MSILVSFLTCFLASNAQIGAAGMFVEPAVILSRRLVGDCVRSQEAAVGWLLKPCADPSLLGRCILDLLSRQAVAELAIRTTSTVMMDGMQHASYLLMPAEQNAHGLTSALTSAARVDLGETGRLWGDVPCCAHRARLSHALVSRLARLAGSSHIECSVGQKGAHGSPPSKRRSKIVCRSGCKSGAYIYFIRTSNASGPPGELYIRLSIGDISAWRMDWRISMTVAR